MPAGARDPWDQLEPAWQAALAEAWAAYRDGSRPVGAVVVDEDGGVLARGRNRARGAGGHPLRHAELEALLGLDPGRDHARLALLTTSEPCALCAEAVRYVGIGRLAYASRETRTSGLARLDGVAVAGPWSAALERALVALHVEWEHRHGDPGSPHAAGWCAELPEAAEVGRSLADDGSLRWLADSGRGVRQALAFVLARGSGSPSDWPSGQRSSR